MIFSKKYIFPAAAVAAFAVLSGCSKKQEEVPVETRFIMHVPSYVRAFTTDKEEAAKVTEAVFAEWKRISDEYSFSEAYTSTSYINKRAYGEWVKIDDEFLSLLVLSMEYYTLTDGAFDITFAPLWPVWKEAAASKKMPSKDEIARALSSMGSQYVQIDRKRKMVRFSKPVQINMGGILRAYCLARGYQVLKKMVGDRYPVELKLGGYMLAYGKRDWSYEVPDPFHEGKSLGMFRFDEGVVMSSSGRDHFVQIEGKLYSHILDLKTGYPVPDFSNLIVYFPTMQNGACIPSAVLAVMGKAKAFSMITRVPGAAALWIDGSGRSEFFSSGAGHVSWEKAGKFFR